jgi:glycosyltransferase involved in cell wall biosynthesis
LPKQTSEVHEKGFRLSTVDAMRKYRVLMLAPTSFFADYGCHVRILEETVALRQMGHEVKLCTYPTGRDVLDLPIERTTNLPGGRELEVGASHQKIALDMLLSFKSLAVAMRWRPDVIHAHLHEGALIGHPISLICRAPLIFDFQGSLTSEMIDHGFLRADSRLYPFMLHLEHIIDRLPSVIIVNSRHARNLLKRDFDIVDEKTHIVPDCVNADAFAPHNGKEHKLLMKQRLGIPTDSKVVVYLGLLAEHQGTRLLMHALADLLETRRKLHALVMGYPWVEHYAAMAESLGIAAKVTFTGRIPYFEAPHYLDIGDVAVSAKISATEGQGKLPTYMAMGLPTVAFDTAVSREYLGEWGIYATFGDPLSLAECIAFALDNPEQAAELGSNLRERAISEYSWEAAGRKIIEIYDSCRGQG